MAKYIIKVETNPTFCGIDAGGVQFANGQAIIEECPLLNWFREHKGYSVEAFEEAFEEAVEEKAEAVAEEKTTAKKSAAKKATE